MTSKFPVTVVASAACLLLSGCSIFGGSSSESYADPEEIAEQIEAAKAEGGAYVRDDSALYQTWNRGGAAFRLCEQTQVLYNDHHEGGSVRSIQHRWEADAALEAEARAAADGKQGGQQAGKAKKNRDRSIYSKRDRSIYSKRDRSIYAAGKKPFTAKVKKLPAPVEIKAAASAAPAAAPGAGHPVCPWWPGMTHEEKVKAGFILPSVTEPNTVREGKILYDGEKLDPRCLLNPGAQPPRPSGKNSASSGSVGSSSAPAGCDSDNPEGC